MANDTCEKDAILVLIRLMCEHICSCISIYIASMHWRAGLIKVVLLLEIPGAKYGCSNN
jgi:hypothetical protein